MKGTMKMVKAGPSTYYSDAIVKHCSSVSSGLTVSFQYFELYYPSPAPCKTVVRIYGRM